MFGGIAIRFLVLLTIEIYTGISEAMGNFAPPSPVKRNVKIEAKKVRVKVSEFLYSYSYIGFRRPKTLSNGGRHAGKNGEWSSTSQGSPLANQADLQQMF